MRLSYLFAASTLGLLLACARSSPSTTTDASVVSMPATVDLPDAFKTSEDSGTDIARDATADGSIEAGPDASHALTSPFTGLGPGGPPETPHGWTSGQVTHAPRLRDGAITTNRLPMEVVRRIMRANFPRFRSCYEAGLRNNPALHGRVTLKFVIDTAGNTKSAQDGGSDLPDPKVIACMINVVQTLSFPSPESGEANVVYPITFEPTDE